MAGLKKLVDWDAIQMINVSACRHQVAGYDGSKHLARIDQACRQGGLEQRFGGKDQSGHASLDLTGPMVNSKRQVSETTTSSTADRRPALEVGN